MYVLVTPRDVNLHSFALICTHVQGAHASGALKIEAHAGRTRYETRGQGRTAFLDNGGQGGQRGWSSATYVFCGVEC